MQKSTLADFTSLTFLTLLVGMALAAFAGVSLVGSTAAYAQAGDPLAGELAYRARCSGCHTASEDGGNRTGPKLFGAFGAPAGQRDIGYRFSEALASSGVTWDTDSLDQWLRSPRAFIPGNRMSFGGMSSAVDRANVITFLRTRSNNPDPTPAPPPQPVLPPPSGTGSNDQAANAAAPQIILFQATLDQTQTEPRAISVPGANGSGVVLLNTDTNEISWLIDFIGLSGPLTGVHFHGPAGPGEAAGLLLDIGTASGFRGPLAGRATLNNELIRSLAAGQWYINLHTDLNAPGELRGQLVP